MSALPMTARDWYGLLDQGFRIEIAPPAPQHRGRKRNTIYGLGRKLATEYLDSQQSLSVDDFADLKKFPREKLAKAVKNLKEERKYGYRRRHKSQARPGSTYGEARRLAIKFLDSSHGLTRDQFAAKHGIVLERLSQAIRGLRQYRARQYANKNSTQ